MATKAERQDYILPLQQVQVTPRTPPGAQKTPGEFVSVHYGDTHFPFQDNTALKVFYQILRDLKPNLVVHHGDLVDAYTISRYEKDPTHRTSLDTEIRQAAEHLATVARLVPKARRVLIKGNHEDRLRRLIWNESRGPLKEILQLAKVEEHLNWPSLLGLSSSGWEWQEQKEILFGRMVLKHGSVVRRHSAQSAKAEQERYSKSGISGHTHRMGSYFVRDWNGQHGWWETGCMCGLDPEYVEDPNWQQGFVVVTWSKRRDYFNVEPVHIHKGKALFRGALYF